MHCMFSSSFSIVYRLSWAAWWHHSRLTLTHRHRQTQMHSFTYVYLKCCLNQLIRPGVVWCFVVHSGCVLTGSVSSWTSRTISTVVVIAVQTHTNVKNAMHQCHPSLKNKNKNKYYYFLLLLQMIIYRLQVNSSLLFKYNFYYLKTIYWIKQTQRHNNDLMSVLVLLF